MYLKLEGRDWEEYQYLLTGQSLYSSKEVDQSSVPLSRSTSVDVNSHLVKEL